MGTFSSYVVPFQISGAIQCLVPHNRSQTPGYPKLHQLMAFFDWNMSSLPMGCLGMCGAQATTLVSAVGSWRRQKSRWRSQLLIQWIHPQPPSHRRAIACLCSHLSPLAFSLPWLRVYHLPGPQNSGEWLRIWITLPKANKKTNRRKKKKTKKEKKEKKREEEEGEETQAIETKRTWARTFAPFPTPLDFSTQKATSALNSAESQLGNSKVTDLHGRYILHGWGSTGDPRPPSTSCGWRKGVWGTMCIPFWVGISCFYEQVRSLEVWDCSKLLGWRPAIPATAPVQLSISWAIDWSI